MEYDVDVRKIVYSDRRGVLFEVLKPMKGECPCGWEKIGKRYYKIEDIYNLVNFNSNGLSFVYESDIGLGLELENKVRSFEKVSRKIRKLEVCCDEQENF